MRHTHQEGSDRWSSHKAPGGHAQGGCEVPNPCPCGSEPPDAGSKKKKKKPPPRGHHGPLPGTGRATSPEGGAIARGWPRPPPGTPSREACATSPDGQGPRATSASRSPGRPPCHHLPWSGLCHLPGPPASPPRAPRAASPGGPGPRRSGRPGASRLRARPPPRAQPAWRGSAGRQLRSETAGRASGPRPPSRWSLPLLPERACRAAAGPCAPPTGRAPSRPSGRGPRPEALGRRGAGPSQPPPPTPRGP